MPLVDSDGHLVDLHADAALCPRCDLPGLRITSVKVAEGKWRVVYGCPVCQITWYSFKGQKKPYEAAANETPD